MALRRRDGHDLGLHLYMCVVRESVLSHHDARVVREPVRHRCTCEVRELVLRLYGNDLLVHRRDGRAGRE
jgi:hypothetical protein